MNEIIEELKKDFNGSADYMSGVNDGMTAVSQEQNTMKAKEVAKVAQSKPVK